MFPMDFCETLNAGRSEELVLEIGIGRNKKGSHWGLPIVFILRNLANFKDAQVNFELQEKQNLYNRKSGGSRNRSN